MVDLGMRLYAAIRLQAPFVGVSDPILGRICDIEGLARKVSSRSGFFDFAVQGLWRNCQFLSRSVSRAVRMFGKRRSRSLLRRVSRATSMFEED